MVHKKGYSIYLPACLSNTIDRIQHAGIMSVSEEELEVQLELLVESILSFLR
jgi:predicted HTH domain antitoxin